MTVAEPRSTSQTDAMYCFEAGSPPIGCNPPVQASSDSVELAVASGPKQPGFGAFDSLETFGEGTGKYPAYNPDHRYEQTFVFEWTGRMWALTSPPQRNAGQTASYSGGYNIKVFALGKAPTPTPAPTQTPRFGGDGLTFSAPAPGGGLLARSPLLSSSMRRLGAAVSLTGAAPGRTFAASSLRITDGRKLLAMCAVSGNITIPQGQVQIAGGSPHWPRSGRRSSTRASRRSATG